MKFPENALLRQQSAVIDRRYRTKKSPAPKSIRGWVLATSYSRATYRCTTIGAAAFHFRVRNGNGWCHCARITRGVGIFRFAIADLRLEFRAGPSRNSPQSLVNCYVAVFQRTRFSICKIGNLLLIL